MTQENIEYLKSEIRIQSVNYSNAMAKVNKNIQSILDYDLAMAIDMASCDEWDISPSRVLRLLRDIETKLNETKKGDY
jgi:hypothetical protein